MDSSDSKSAGLVPWTESKSSGILGRHTRLRSLKKKDRSEIAAEVHFQPPHQVAPFLTSSSSITWGTENRSSYAVRSVKTAK